MYVFSRSSSSSSYYINNRQPKGSLSNVLSRLAVGVRVDGDELELELELELDSFSEVLDH